MQEQGRRNFSQFATFSSLARGTGGRLAYPLVATSAMALVLAGCGGPGRLTLAKTRQCLAGQPGLRLGPPPATDVVAASALGGAVEVRMPGNAVVISFGQDEEEAERIASAYRRFRGRTIGIEDILRPRRNAVLLWRAHPRPEHEQAVTGCLK